MIVQDTNITVVDRPNLLESYQKRMVDYLVRTEHADPDEALDFVTKTMAKTYKSQEVTYIKTVKVGKTEVATEDLREFILRIHNKVISPSGSVYMPTAEHASPVSEFLNYKAQERKKYKKQMLKMLAQAKDREANRFNYLQASVKIRMNALPGSYGSKYAIFCDKGSYNAITSTGRAQISRSSANVEMFLGGMLSFFSENDLINYVLVALHYMTPAEEVQAMIDKYHLKVITPDMLYKYFRQFCLEQKEYEDARIVISGLSNLECTYLFYHGNLKNLFQENTEVFKPLIQSMLDPTQYTPVDGTADDIYAFDDPVRALVSVAFADYLDKQSVETIVKDHKEKIPVFIGLAKGLMKRMDELKELLSVFCWTMDDIPNVKSKQQAPRNTVILQDTDSNLYTCAQWGDWYSGRQRFDVDSQSLAIDAFVSYLLHVHMEFVMWKFSRAIGCTSPNMKTISMKGEFVYSIVILYEVKKVYSNLIICREGQMMPKLTPDIKGVLLRGSSKAEEVNNMTEDLIVNHILVPATHGKISAKALIEHVKSIENGIEESLLAGETTYLNSKSVRPESDYKNPDVVTINKAYIFWSDIFSRKYGEIQRPTKCHAFPTIAPDKGFIEDLKKTNKNLGERLETWLQTHKFPSEMIVNSALEKIPKEIVPFINVRKIIYQNCQAIYYTLRRLGIAVGDPKLMLLFKDLY